MNGEIADRESTINTTARLRHLAMVALASAAVGCTSLVAGCSTPLKEPGASPYALAHTRKVDRRYVEPKVKNGVLIMPFFSHHFGSYCFDTLRCRVLYQNRYDTDQDAPSDALAEHFRSNLSGGWILDNFPSVARVSWTSNDGVKHDEMVDLGQVFRTRLVLYSPDLNVNDVDLGVYYLPPDVILVVEDRSINVYMKAHISLLNPIIPGNKYSNFRSDLVVAYSQKF